jgi:hypothetical protein
MKISLETCGYFFFCFCKKYWFYSTVVVEFKLFHIEKVLKKNLILDYCLRHGWNKYKHVKSIPIMFRNMKVFVNNSHFFIIK